MKKKLAMLFVVIMILSCMPVMAGTAAAGVDSTAAAKTVTMQAAKNGWVKEGSYYKYYVNGKYYKNGVYKIDGKYFGFSAKGNLCCGWFTINGKTYYGSVNSGAKGIGVGEVLMGYRKIGNDYYVLNKSKKGERYSGFATIGGKRMYFGADGKQRRTKGWFYVGNAMYYVKADGTIAVNTTVDGYKVGPTGAVVDAYGCDKKAQGYDSNTRYMVTVNKSNHVVNVYQGSKGSWVNIRRNMPCSIGKSSTPTKSGTFRIKFSLKSQRAYGYKDFSSAKAFYTTGYSAVNFFHSVTYSLSAKDPYNYKPKDSRMGKNISNACVRLQVPNAKYIYDKMPDNTRVVVY